ncbi:MAG: hypothetical protein EBY57_09015, partial [Actinobacteria bacterium]|nr:hypothetical protein [Actinomycetota bacterium]
MTIAIKHGGNIDDRRKQALAAAKRKRESGAGGKRHERHDRLSIREALQRDRAVEASRTYFAIIAVVAIMVLLGLVMLLSASGPLRAAGDGSPYSMVIRQSIFAIAGLGLMAVVIRVRYQLFRRLISLIWAVGIGMMALPFVPGWSHEVNDANSWVSVGGMTFQPSEVFKLSVILGVADILTRRKDVLNDWRRTIVPIGAVTGVAFVFSLIQGDFGSAVVLVLIVMAMSFIAGIPWMHIGTVVGVGGFIGAIMVFASPRRFGRITAFFDIEGNKEHYAYQVWQGMLSIANGGLTGSGIGGSRSKLGYLPLAHSDFIFAIIADELGLIGV